MRVPATLRAILRRPRVARLALALLPTLLAGLLLVGLALPARAAGPSVDEVKAAYIHKFLGYIDWPGDEVAGQRYVVGVTGSDQVYAELQQIAAARPVQGHAVDVRRLGRNDDLADVHLAFVGQDAWRALPHWIAAAKGKPVAIVTDAPKGAEQGALLTFVRADDRVRFEASLRAARLAGLVLSARLLEVADRVLDARP